MIPRRFGLKLARKDEEALFFDNREPSTFHRWIRILSFLANLIFLYLLRSIIPPPLLLSLSFIHWQALSIDTRRVYEVREINGLVGIDCFLKLRSETDQIDYCGIVCLWSERFFFVVSRFWLWEIRSKGFVRYIVKIVFIWANLNVF